MSFPRYPKYKDSSIEWLGEVPEHWKSHRLKNIATLTGGGTPSRDNLSFWKGNIPWVSPKDMKFEEVIRTEEYITEAGLQNSATVSVLPGAVLLVVRSGILKHTIPVAINRVTVALNQDMKAIRFSQTVCLSSFFLRWVQGLNDRLLFAWSKQGATVESIEQSCLANTNILLPPLREQVAIVDFLDRETAKIDALVAEQERLIELLKEKRQAVISHCVTKGLDPTVPMKDSGIDWLREIPADWTVARVGHFLLVLPGYAFPSGGFSSDTSATRLLRGVNVGVGGVRWEDVVYWRREPDDGLEPFELREGDVVVGMDRPWIGSGLRIARLCQSDLPCLLLQRVAALRPTKRLNPEFLCYVLNSPSFYHHCAPDLTGVSVPHLSPGQVGDFAMPLPSVRQQERIVVYLNRETVMFDRLVEEAEVAVSLLRERRAAVISAAVTGKVDMRGLAETEAAEHEVFAS